MDLRWLRFAANQIVVRTSRHLPEPRAMILALDDLPPGWKVLDERRWRTGMGKEPWAIRVRKLGGLTAWRSFVAASNDRWLWVQASPLANVEDAQAALEAFWSNRLKNLAAQVSVTATHDGPDLTLSGGSVKTVEQLTTGPVGPGTSRYLAWTHGRVVSALAGSAFGEPWPWQSLEEVASKQNRRIDAVISR